ncbi:MAG: HMA2 domain-containing protein [Candidatus Binatia bacterium]
MQARGYLHALDGRIRIKSPAIKRAPQRAAEVEQQLREYGGITEVTTNPVTGSVLVQYDAQRLTQEQVLTFLQKTGCLADDHAYEVRTATVTDVSASVVDFSRGLVRTVALSTMEFAVQRLVYAIL